MLQGPHKGAPVYEHNGVLASALPSQCLHVERQLPGGFLGLSDFRFGSRAADQVGRKESSESHRWTCNAERPLTKAQRAYSDLAVECQVPIPR